MSRKRVLLVGYGNIGSEVFKDYGPRLAPGFMVTDLRVPVPAGFEWDGERVDVAVICVDTPSGPGSTSPGWKPPSPSTSPSPTSS